MSKSTIGQDLYVLPLGMAFAFGLTLLVGILGTMNTLRPSNMALAQGVTIRYVAPTGNDNNNNCTNATAPCATIQHAVDVADLGDEIRVAAGTYTDVHTRPRKDINTTGIVTQVVYISQTLIIRGGYSTTDWDTPHLLTQTTTLDAQGQGRGLYIAGAISPTIEGLRITGGNAAGLVGDPSMFDAGGGVYIISATVTLSNSHIFSNSAGAGGGLFVLNGQNITLASNIIVSNTAGNRAGGLYFRNSPGARLTTNTIENNEAPNTGGGQESHGGILFLSSNDAYLMGNRVIGNTAADQCGGITFNGSENSKLVGNIVMGNHSGTSGFAINSSGGGLCFITSSGAYLSRNLVNHNSAYGHGGGLYVERSNMTMTNNVIADNQILASKSFTGTGSGLHIAGSSPQLIHTTIARNSGGDGSGTYVTDIFSSFSHVAMTNTIIVDHVTGITVTTGNAATLNGVLWHNNGLNSSDMNTVIITKAYTGDPAFSADGYHLTDDSDAIDKGVNTAVSDDIDGEIRPSLAAPDLGADELCCLFYYLPVIFKE